MERRVSSRVRLGGNLVEALAVERVQVAKFRGRKRAQIEGRPFARTGRTISRHCLRQFQVWYTLFLDSVVLLVANRCTVCVASRFLQLLFHVSTNQLLLRIIIHDSPLLSPTDILQLNVPTQTAWCVPGTTS